MITEERIRHIEDILVNHRHLGYDSTKSLGFTVFAGSVDSSGNSVFLPPGWSSTKTATGTYVVTHSIGRITYAVTATTISLNTRATSIQIAANSFTVYIGNSSNTAGEDNNFNFTLIY